MGKREDLVSQWIDGFLPAQSHYQDLIEASVPKIETVQSSATGFGWSVTVTANLSDLNTTYPASSYPHEAWYITGNGVFVSNGVEWLNHNITLEKAIAQPHQISDGVDIVKCIVSELDDKIVINLPTTGNIDDSIDIFCVDSSMLVISGNIANAERHYLDDGLGKPIYIGVDSYSYIVFNGNHSYSKFIYGSGGNYWTPTGGDGLLLRRGNLERDGWGNDAQRNYAGYNTRYTLSEVEYNWLYGQVPEHAIQFSWNDVLNRSLVSTSLEIPDWRCFLIPYGPLSTISSSEYVIDMTTFKPNDTIKILNLNSNYSLIKVIGEGPLGAGTPTEFNTELELKTYFNLNPWVKGIYRASDTGSYFISTSDGDADLFELTNVSGPVGGFKLINQNYLQWMNGQIAFNKLDTTGGEAVFSLNTRINVDMNQPFQNLPILFDVDPVYAIDSACYKLVSGLPLTGSPAILINANSPSNNIPFKIANETDSTITLSATFGSTINGKSSLILKPSNFYIFVENNGINCIASTDKNAIYEKVHTLSVVASGDPGVLRTPYVFGSNNENILQLGENFNFIAHILIDNTLPVGTYKIQPFNYSYDDIYLQIDINCDDNVAFTEISGSGFRIPNGSNSSFEFEIVDSAVGKGFIKKSNYSNENTRFNGGFDSYNGYTYRYTLNQIDYNNLLGGKIGRVESVSALYPSGFALIRGLDRVNYYNQTYIVDRQSHQYADRIELYSDFSEFSRVRFCDSYDNRFTVYLPVNAGFRSSILPTGIGNFAGSAESLVEAAVDATGPGYYTYTDMNGDIRSFFKTTADGFGDTVEFQYIGNNVWEVVAYDFISWINGSLPWGKIDKAAADPKDIGGEPDLGTPAATGMVLTSDLAGNRSWKEIVAGISTVGTTTTSADIVLTSSSQEYQVITSLIENQSVVLPNATTLKTRWPNFIICNKGVYQLQVKNAVGTIVGRLNQNQTLTATVTNISTSAGTWEIGNISPQGDLDSVFNTSSGYVFHSATVTGYATAPISSDKVLVVYTDGANSNRGTVALLTVSAGTIVTSAVSAITSSGINILGLKPLTDSNFSLAYTRFVLVYKDYADGYTKSLIIVYNKNTKLIESDYTRAVTISNSGTFVYSGNSVANINSTVSVVGVVNTTDGYGYYYKLIHDDNADQYALVVSPITKITDNTESVKTNLLNIQKMGDGMALISYAADNYLGYGHAQVSFKSIVVDVYGALTLSPVTRLDGWINESLNSVIPISSSKAVVLYFLNSTYDAQNTQRYCIVELSNSGIEVTPPTVWLQGSGVYAGLTLSESSFLMYNGSGVSLKGYIANVSNDKVTMPDSTSKYTSIPGVTVSSFINTVLTKNLILTVYKDTNNSNYGTAKLINIGYN